MKWMLLWAQLYYILCFRCFLSSFNKTLSTSLQKRKCMPLSLGAKIRLSKKKKKLFMLTNAALSRLLYCTHPGMVFMGSSYSCLVAVGMFTKSIPNLIVVLVCMCQNCKSQTKQSQLQQFIQSLKSIDGTNMHSKYGSEMSIWYQISLESTTNILRLR